MPNEYAKAVNELVRAKVEHRAPEITRSGRCPFPSPSVLSLPALSSITSIHLKSTHLRKEATDEPP